MDASALFRIPALRRGAVLGLVAAACTLGAGTARAGDVYWSIGISTPQVGTVVSNLPPPAVVYAPPPVVVAPAPVYLPPPPAYYRPGRVYYRPAPVVYVRPAPVRVVSPRGHGHRGGRHGGPHRGHGHGHGHHR